MASFGDQLRAAKTASLAVSTLEGLSRDQIKEHFASWDSGSLSAQQVRYAMENVLRSAYRSAAAIGAAHAAEQSEIPGWKPSAKIFNTPYLDDLRADVRRNLRDYKAGPKDDKARRKAQLRMQLSAAVAAQRGLTDSLISSYTELEDFGFRIEKVWLANFVANDPCQFCRSLHGTRVDLHDSFKSPKGPKIYRDLQGPPRHPNCHCYLCMLIVTLENAFDTLDIEDPTPPPQMVDTDDVKKMSKGTFSAIVKAITAIIKFLRKDH